MPLLNEIVIIFGLAVAVLFICHRLRLPTVVGLLLTGIAVGPSGLGLVKATHDVEILAEVGVVLLLFTIGIEFSFKRLLQIRTSVLLGGSLQVSLTCLATFLIARRFGQGMGESVFIGFLVALSSTAIVLTLLQERAEIDSPHGRMTLGILIFQDIAIVPMILVTPLLSGAPGAAETSLLSLLGKGIGIILMVLVGAKWVVPRVLRQIVRTRNQELFLLTMIVICFGVAWVTFQAGLSLALGAFLAGLIISESKYSHHALGNILPFRDVFRTFFFVSIGMMLDVSVLFQHAGVIALLLITVLALKGVVAGSVALLLRYPLRASVIVGCALAQIGEFSFILSKTGVEHGLLSGSLYQMFLAVSVLSMAATPFAIGLAPRLAGAIVRLPLPSRLVSGVSPVASGKVAAKKDHVIIIGFGVIGRNVARAAKAGAIPYAIIEMNPETVRTEERLGEPIFYGDATHEAVLRHANIDEARVVVIAINDPTATRGATEVCRRLSARAHLIVRTRYLLEMGPLYELGATEVIPEEFETSVEIFTRVLSRYLVPKRDIAALVAETRLDGYAMFRSLSKPSADISDLNLDLHDVDISAFRVCDSCGLTGKSLAEIDLRARYGVSVVAIQRGDEVLSNPAADVSLLLEDVLYVIGSSEEMTQAFDACARGDIS